VQNAAVTAGGKIKVKNCVCKKMKLRHNNLMVNEKEYDNIKYFQKLDRYLRTANYLSAAQLYLLDNPLLERPLSVSDVKKKIVGHWGTVPGQNFIYAHLSRAVNKHGREIIYISGPGHGGNFFVANAYIEGTYSEIYPDITRDKAGLQKLFKQFSFPYGISSHVAPEVPGSLHEGGELGYSLAHGFGAVLDRPNTICAVVVGDGEAETGPLATGWWGIKFLNPKTDGAVLPILHLNGYKISNPTVLSRITPAERFNYFKGMGYNAIEIEVGANGETIMVSHKKMAKAIDAAIAQIKDGGHPMIILKSPKGWTGVAAVANKQIEGTFRAHQVPVDMSAPEHLNVVDKWLKSYKPYELFNADGTIMKDILSVAPKGAMRISANPRTRGGTKYNPLVLGDVNKHFIDVKRGETFAQDMLVLSHYVADIMANNRESFRFFSPDEAKSNRLYAPFNVTKRSWTEELFPYDEDLSPSGRIMDSMLSEHICEGMLEGYVLTGRHGFFASYESFARVVDSMLTQHLKWLKLTKDMKWRTPLPCLNLVATSHVWQQDHNGYTHQDPGLAAHLLDKNQNVVRAYYPADANTLLATFTKCMKDTNKINIITASKHPSRQWLTKVEAIANVKNGISVWDWAGTAGENEEPDIVLACCGDTPTLESITAVKLVKDKFPRLKIRFVNVLDLGKLGGRSDSLTDKEYADIFTNNKPVVFVHHGYTNIIKALVFDRPNANKYIFAGYQENGAITTGFDMRAMNQIDRFHIANYIIPAAEKYYKADEITNACRLYSQKLDEHAKYAAEYGADPVWITDINTTF
jgi:xylulose-5-phosphate/fructose-6-phosphate phosphoketolase